MSTLQSHPIDLKDEAGGKLGAKRSTNKGTQSFLTMQLLQIHSLEDLEARLLERKAAQEAVQAVVRSPLAQGIQKHHAICNYIFKYRRSISSCPRCWLLPGLCVCKLMKPVQTRTRVVLHMHSSEWLVGCLGFCCSRPVRGTV